MSATIPNGNRASRKQRLAAVRPDGNEARYMLAYTRWRAGVIDTRPSPGRYLGNGWDYGRCYALEAAADAMIALVRETP